MWHKINLGHTQSYIHLSKKRVGRMHTIAIWKFTFQEKSGFV